jgi:hypothetical protein
MEDSPSSKRNKPAFGAPRLEIIHRLSECFGARLCAKYQPQGVWPSSRSSVLRLVLRTQPRSFG